MSYDQRSPFAINLSWDTAPNYGADSYDQPWVHVSGSSPYWIQQGNAGLKMLQHLTVVDGLATGFGASSSYTQALGGHTFYTSFQVYTTSGDEALDSIDNRSGKHFRLNYQLNNTYSSATHSRSVIFALESAS